MTDRKLPVIYVQVTPDKSSILTNPDDEIELVDPPFLRALDAAAEGCTVVPYEPTVPRCKTCGWFRFAEHATICGKGILSFPSIDDYCSRHSELRQ